MSSNTVEHQCVRCLRVTPARPAKCLVCGFPEQTPSFIMVYEARRAGSARSAFKKDLARLRQQVYEPMPEQAAWVPGDAKGKMRTLVRLAIFEWINFFYPPVGHLRVHLRRWDLTPEQAMARPTDAIAWGA